MEDFEANCLDVLAGVLYRIASSIDTFTPRRGADDIQTLEHLATLLEGQEDADLKNIGQLTRDLTKKLRSFRGKSERKARALIQAFEALDQALKDVGGDRIDGD